MKISDKNNRGSKRALVLLLMKQTKLFSLRQMPNPLNFSFVIFTLRSPHGGSLTLTASFGTNVI